MPIRMVEDNPKGNKRRIPSRPGGGASGGGLISMLLPILLKNPKLLMIGAVLFGLFYLFSPETASTVVNQAFSTGMAMSPQVYQQTDIYEPLADNKKNPLPSQVSLLKYAPQRLNQGSQGSCVGWASSYAARTILYAKQTGKDPNQVRFSPSSLYNEINLPNCQGAYVHTAMKTMKEQGVLPYNEFPYNENSCENELNSSQKRNAENFKISGYNRLTKGSDPRNMETDMLAIKQNISQGAPVIIGMMVGGSFMQNMNGKDRWIPTNADYKMQGFGGHAMCVIGYDDFKDGGSFLLMNSWGEDWGERGVAWISYADFSYFNKEAYGLYPMGDAFKKEPTEIELEFGLINNTTKQNVQFTQKDSYLFQTTKAIKKGDKFKLSVRNDATCYIYLFGMETDKSSYVLFPYTPKHSPYCGIVGTRIFPRDFSLQADQIGTKDYMAVVVTKEPIDYDLINQEINKSQGASYYKKILNYFGSNLVQTNFQTDSNIAFKGKFSSKNTLAIVMEIDKTEP